MPELPEVETVVRELRAGGLVGRAIVSAHVFWAPIVMPLAPSVFAARLRRRVVRSIRRRAKYIVVKLSGPDGQSSGRSRQGATLLIHLRMSGQLNLVDSKCRRERHQHVILRLDDGRDLRYRDTRKFGRWILTHVPGAILNRLGPEPLSSHFDLKSFGVRLNSRHRQLKPLLLDQTFLAGLGNIYVDEALWAARLHPARGAATLGLGEARRLRAAIRRVLRRGIRNMGTTLGNGQSNFQRPGGRRGRNQDGLNVFRKAGLPCARCGAPIRRIIIGQRSTHFCPVCQPFQPADQG